MMSACSKFTPNFFNKNKCQNCFKLKNCHNDQSSTEKHQTVRTVIRCSFLFVTPECHSTLNGTLSSNNKTRKFQRRWFILYSNGELTYSLDQSSLTLPQNVIKIKECELICLAPDVHEYAIAIVYLDKIYYIRANHADEMEKWFDDLSQFITKKNSIASKSSITNGKQCVVVDAVHKIQQQQQQQESASSLTTTKPLIKTNNPVFKLLSYVNEIKSENCVDSQIGNSEVNGASKVLISNEKSDKKTYIKNINNLKTNSNSQDDYTVIRFQASSSSSSTTSSSKRNKSLPDLRATPRKGALDHHHHHHPNNNLNTKEDSKVINSSRKCGWLMRKGQNSREWFRHWFVLKDTLLTYYRDQPAAESNSLLDGVLDLALVKHVHSSNTCFTLHSTTYYPFSIHTMWNQKQHELAALSSESRADWIRLIVASSQSQINFIASKEHCDRTSSTAAIATATTANRSNSDAETAESSDSNESNEVFSNFSEKKHQMPSSPPLNRNAISRMKHKLKETHNKNNSNNLVNSNNNHLHDSGLASSDDLINVADSLPGQQTTLDQPESIESAVQDSKDNELNRIKFSIVELHKFCLNIINELQLIHSSVSELKRNLMQKDFFTLLGNQLLNGTNGSFQIDTFRGQLLDSLMSNFKQQQQQSEKQTKPNNDNLIDLNRELNCDPSADLDLNGNQQPTLSNLMSKNEQLEHRLRISLRTLQTVNSELKESYQNYDHLEIAFLCYQNKFKTILKMKQDEYDLLTEKINYLTAKLVQVEKAYRLSTAAAIAEK